MGAIFQQRNGPLDVNWPKFNSRKNSGIPTKKRNIPYGIRNTPL